MKIKLPTIKFEYMPYASWFTWHYSKMNEGINDLGDYVIMISRIQIKIFKFDNKYKNWTKKDFDEAIERQNWRKSMAEKRKMLRY